MIDKKKLKDPGEPIEFTDVMGDKMSIAPAGKGRVLFSIENSKTGNVEFAEFEYLDLMPIFTTAVKATGLDAREISEEAIKRGLVAKPPQPTGRAARRRAEREARKKK